MNKISIAHIIDTIETDTAGTQKQLIEIIKRLDKNKFDSYLICLWESAWMRVNKLPCDTVVLGYKGFLKANFLKVVRRLSQVLGDKKIDIIQTYFEDSIFVSYLGAMVSKRKPVLLTSRRDIGLGSGRPWYHSIYRIVLPFVNMSFDGMVVNSLEVKRIVSRREIVPDRKIKVIPNGIELPAKNESEPNIFSKVKGDVWIAVAASLTPVKRLDVFLEAISKIIVIRPDISFQALILGDGPERSKLLDLAQDLNIGSRVHFVGAVKNVVAYLQRSDIGVLCSDREGLSNAILEYMACGLPVIASDAGGNIELVDSSNGALFARGDANALAIELAALATNNEERERKGKRSLERIRTCYSWERTIGALEGYYGAWISKRKNAAV